jgi:hypothetical protein
MLLISGRKDVMKNIIPERAICMKDDDGNEYIIVYLNRCLLDTETRRFEYIIADTLSQVSPLAEDLIDMFFGHCPKQ